MHQSGHPPRMFMRDHEAILSCLEQWIQEGCRKHMVLVGVTWAILDWLDAGLLPEALNNAEVAGKFVLLETGGMKGRGWSPSGKKCMKRSIVVSPAFRLPPSMG